MTCEVVTLTSMTLLTSSAPWKPKKYIGSCSILSAQNGNCSKCFSKFSLQDKGEGKGREDGCRVRVVGRTHRTYPDNCLSIIFASLTFFISKLPHKVGTFRRGGGWYGAWNIVSHPSPIVQSRLCNNKLTEI